MDRGVGEVISGESDMTGDHSGAKRALTGRSVFLGLGMVLLVSLSAPYWVWIVGSSEITWSFFPIGVGVPFIFIVLGNALCRRFKSSWALEPAERIIILVMGLVVSGIPIFITGYVLAILSAPYYAATPENDWAGFIHPYLPSWAVPQDTGEAMRWFYEGMPAGQNLPYEVWIGPLAWWLSLIIVVQFVCFCLVVIFRRQWVDHERLIFPLAELPRRLVEDEGAAVPPLLRARSFWIGCAVSLGIMLFNLISFFNPGFPQLAIHQPLAIDIDPSFPTIYVMLFLPVLGIMFLASTSISFSIWIFHLVAFLQEGITNRIGYDVTRPDAFVWGMQSLSWQAWGAFMAMVLWSLWMGRRHLAAVFRHVFRRGELLDDREEMLSYRTAVFGGLAGLVYILWWLHRAGMDLHVAALFVFGVMVAYVGITRLVIQSGVYYLTTPVVAQAFTLAVTGTAIAPTNLVALSLCYTWFGDVQSIFMPSAAHAARLSDFFANRRALGIAIGLAVLVGFISSTYFLLHLCYQSGAGNFRSWVFRPDGGAGGMALDGVVHHINNPWPTDWGKLFYFGIGAAVYSVVIFCQYRFYWWPLHPMGLTIASLWMMRRIWISIFLAWAIKSVILHFGGISAYRQARPFFLGLVVGFFLGMGVSYAVDWIWFFGQGHVILN